jgi:integral membrane protein (TIGR00529 family)
MAILKVFIICLLLLLWIIGKKDLGLGLLLSSALLGMFYISPVNVGIEIFKSLYSWESINLILSLTFIYYFIGLWRASGATTSLVKGIENTKLHPFIALVLPSALLGLLPIVGGALMSAPLFDESKLSSKLSQAKKTFLNYWFRHLWEYILPTYPAIIVTASLLNMPYSKIFLSNLPLTVTAIIAGVLVGFVKADEVSVEQDRRVDDNKVVQNILNISVSLLPLMLIIIFTLLFKIALFLSIGIVVVCMIVLYKFNFSKAWGIFKETFTATNISLVWGIISFKNILKRTDIVSQVSQEFLSLGVPMFLVALLLPFIVGFLTGVAVAYVSIAFPLFQGYLLQNLQYFTMVYLAGYLGVLLTPMHYCLSLTRQYFNSSWRDVYRLLALPCILLVLVALICAKI